MNNFIKLFLTDFVEFVENNWKVLIICLNIIIVFQYLGKGNSLINIFVVNLHIAGDVMMIISFSKFAQLQNKSGAVYLSASNILFVVFGLTAVLQSNENKNWQYCLGTVPFVVANIYQNMAAWNIKGKEIFNYKLTTLTTIIIAIIYYKMNLIYNYAWIQVVGFSLFPIFLGIKDSPKVYICRILSVLLMLLGALIDIFFQFMRPGIVPAASISAFFITLIAFFGFIKNAPLYVKKIDKENVLVLKILTLIS